MWCQIWLFHVGFLICSLNYFIRKVFLSFVRQVDKETFSFHNRSGNRLMRLIPCKTMTIWATKKKHYCHFLSAIIWTASSEFGTYRLCEQWWFRRACASAQSRQNLRCSLIQAVSQEEPSDRKPDPWSLWMAGHAQIKFVMTECSKTQIRLTGLICYCSISW